MGPLRLIARLGALGVACCAVLSAGPALAQVVETDLRMTGFFEPSPSSSLTVLNPAADLKVAPTSWLGVSAGYEADIVSGATESLKAGPLSEVDVVSSATDFDDTRHQFKGGLSLTRQETELSAGYSYGFESDYRSQALNVSAATDFLQRNTRIALSYAHGFDSVCTTAYDVTDAPSSRLALDSSTGCFKDGDNRATRDVAIDNFQVTWTQNWTPVLSTQLSAGGFLQHGFLENPYRSVVLAPSGDSALENHPDNRARSSLALRAKYFVRSVDTALTFGVRGYRDTWDILSQTFELSAERYLFSWMRVKARGRYYTQTGALFFSDDYTGGEPVTGPRGQYWTGDRELSSLSSTSLGGRVVLASEGQGDDRVLGFLSSVRATGAFDVFQTDLKEFTWGGKQPDDTTIFLITLSGGASF